VGEAEITASCGDASDSMTVTTFAVIGSFDLAESEIWIVSKTGAQLSVQNILPAGATGSFSYESSDTSVCTVSNSGLISALKPGDATVTVAADSGVTRTCAVHVCYPVTAIGFEPAALELLTGTTAQLTANVTARDQSFVNKLVSFSSSDESMLTVDESGRVTAAAPGTAVVTAIADSGVSAECTVTVRNPEVILLPADLTAIEAEAFVNVDAEKIVIPDGCVSIGSRAFADCGRLCLIEIPGTVTEIAADAFENCSGLTISAPSGSPAEAFALAAGIPFIAK